MHPCGGSNGAGSGPGLQGPGREEREEKRERTWREGDSEIRRSEDTQRQGADCLELMAECQVYLHVCA